MVAVAGSAFLDPDREPDPDEPEPPKRKERIPSSAEIAVEVEWLMSFGFGGEYILYRLGKSRNTLSKALRRADKFHLYRALFPDPREETPEGWARNYMNRAGTYEPTTEP